MGNVAEKDAKKGLKCETVIKPIGFLVVSVQLGKHAILYMKAKNIIFTCPPNLEFA